jgi:hypothetical protein
MSGLRVSVCPESRQIVRAQSGAGVMGGSPATGLQGLAAGACRISKCVPAMSSNCR